MSEKYNELMDKITVTEEMRQRVIKNTASADLAEPVRNKVLWVPQWRKVISVAACFAVLMVGAITLPKVWEPQPSAPIEQGINDIAEYSSLEELAGVLGFPMESIENLPFEVENTTYLSYWGQIGEIDYQGKDGEIAAYRKSVGTDDNSGIYDEFASVIQIKENNVTINLKGDSQGYTLGVWRDGTYAYSLSLSNGLDADAWHKMIAEISFKD